MAELLKDIYSVELINSIAKDCHQHYADFNNHGFIEEVLLDDWQDLELKQRMRRIAEVLGNYLPKNYKQAVDILLLVANNYSGLAHMCFPDFVELFGLDDFKTSMKALENLTEGSTSEFAIRAFIIRYPEKTMNQMKAWSSSTNKHVRRLASEGCRPRLPWSFALPEFKKDPQQVIKLIIPLIDDESLYVRRSVANNLNDISKDNPTKVIAVAEEYLGQSKNIDWVIKHACRGLLKKGDPKVLALFGYSKADHLVIKQFEFDKQVKLGAKQNFKFEMYSNKDNLGKLRIEFIIGFMKANGKRSEKIFKITEGEYAESQKTVSKYFSFKPISTRKYYLGVHDLFIVINGIKVRQVTFDLI